MSTGGSFCAGKCHRCPAAGASWGAPSALLAAPSRLPRRSFGHLRQLLGNTSRRPLPYPPLIAPLGKSPSPELPSPKLWAESCATELHCLPRHRQASPRFCHPQQVAGGVACESDYIPRRAIVGPLHIPEIWARISSAALWKIPAKHETFFLAVMKSRDFKPGLGGFSCTAAKTIICNTFTPTHFVSI